MCVSVYRAPDPSPAYLVELELRDDDFRGGDRDRDGLAVALLTDNCSEISKVQLLGTGECEPPLTWMQYLRR